MQEVCFFVADSDCGDLSDADKKLGEEIRIAAIRKLFGGSFSKELRIADVKEVSNLETEFNELAAQWRKETGMVSMLHKKAMHPAYQRIIGMGKEALPFIFRDLKEHGGHWLWALCAITGEDAAKPEHNLKQAVKAWLDWGEEHGYL
jgi:hypothetical protein